MSAPTLIATWPFAAEPTRVALADLERGATALDAVLEVCRRVDDDPRVESVGWGGSPDRAGHVSLDGAVMLGPDDLGAVLALTRHAHPADLARLVMERSPHVVLAGAGADRFADEQGVPEAELLSPEARARWEEWRAAGAPTERRGHDTVCALALDARGVLAGATSTSGAAWKLPGRVGDSAIFGAGLYVEQGVGAAAATGLGELVLGRCSSFLVVEELRSGATPEEALRCALRRLAGSSALHSEDQVAMIALDANGRVASAALRADFSAVVGDGPSVRSLAPEVVGATA